MPKHPHLPIKSSAQMEPLLRTTGLIFCFILGLSACKKDDCPTVTPNGKRMVLIGNSFFRPYAENLDVVAADAGYDDHSSTLVFRGGENGIASVSGGYVTAYTGSHT
ncbi:MAG: hypothetical protein ACPHYG_06095, partial [Flavobacteriales bacterium]